MGMPQKADSAFELIRRFQQLFTDLSPNQIVERLLRLVAAQPDITRAVLVIRRDNDVFVEAVAQSRLDASPDIAVGLSSNLGDFRGVPQSAIRDCFLRDEHYALPMLYDVSGTHGLSDADYQSGTQSFLLQPIVDGKQVVALIYCESEGPLSALQASVTSLDPLWVFSALLIRQAVDMRSHEQQLEKQRVAEQALWASETYLQAILHHSPALMSVKDLDGNVVLASDYFQHLAYVGEEGCVGKNVKDIFPAEIAEQLTDGDLSVLNTGVTQESELVLEHQDGSSHVYLMVKFPLKNREEETFGICTICTDITERKLAEDALREQQARLNHMAFHDALTGLPNRALFYDRIAHGLARARRSDSQLVLMLLDLDRFKNINDSLGHDAGDMLLKTIAQRLKNDVRDMDTVARLGGDEFVVVLEAMDERSDITQVANKILTALARPMNVFGHDISTSVSIGISVYPQDGSTTEELLKHADVAMYKAKEAGKNDFKFYAEGMNASAVNFLLLENDLRRGIEQEQLQLYYQPQIDLSSGKLIGMEALVRWQHPQRGMVSPVHFIPLAEETGLIEPLGDWVLREACRQLKRWQELDKYHGTVAVNLSPRQFQHGDFVARVEEILTAADLPAEYLELEITETSAMEHAGESINLMNRLNSMGISLAIDDFGTGYSSLAYLKRFPIQKLKIDRSFINDVATDSNDAAIAKSIISLAHNMGLKVLAEGVEDKHQMEWLRARGCDQAQGYYYSQPISARQMEQHLVNGRFVSNANVVQLSLPAATQDLAFSEELATEGDA